MIEVKTSLSGKPMMRAKLEFEENDILTVFRAFSDFDLRPLCDSYLESSQFNTQYGSNFVKI